MTMFGKSEKQNCVNVHFEDEDGCAEYHIKNAKDADTSWNSCKKIFAEKIGVPDSDTQAFNDVMDNAAILHILSRYLSFFFYIFDSSCTEEQKKNFVMY